MPALLCIDFAIILLVPAGMVIGVVVILLACCNLFINSGQFVTTPVLVLPGLDEGDVIGLEGLVAGQAPAGFGLHVLQELLVGDEGCVSSAGGGHG